MINANKPRMPTFLRRPGHRLTLTSGVPVDMADQLAKSTLYYTPDLDNRLSIYDGAAWNNVALDEILGTFNSGGMQAVAQDTLYDVFIQWNHGAPRLQLGGAWTTVNDRSNVPLALQDGVLVLASDHTLLWVGTLKGASAAANTTDDGQSSRLVANVYNQTQKVATASGGAASHNLTATTPNWQAYNGDTTTERYYFVACSPAQVAFMTCFSLMTVPSLNQARIGASLNAFNQAIAQWIVNADPNQLSGAFEAAGVTAPVLLGSNWVNVTEFVDTYVAGNINYAYGYALGYVNV